jgi:hypothetical protein
MRNPGATRMGSFGQRVNAANAAVQAQMKRLLVASQALLGGSLLDVACDAEESGPS